MNAYKYVDRYLLYLQKELNYSLNTVNSYQRDLYKYCEYTLTNNIILKNITKEEIRKYLKYLNISKLSSKTIRRHLSSLRSFYNYLLEKNEVASNIFYFISNPKVEKKLPNYMSVIEIEEMFSIFKNDNFISARDNLLLELMYSSGLRLSECINVKLKDINEFDRVIKINGKGNKNRYVVYGTVLEEKLKSYLEYKDKLNKIVDDNLILTKYGKKVSVSLVQKIITNKLQIIQRKHKISAHTLRHTFATHMLNNGADIKTIGQLLGHSSLSTTQIYTHISIDRMKDIYLKTHPRKKEIKNTS